MNSKKLKYIITIAELKSISKAANELFISQPSLSSILTNLEKELGVTLFNRSTSPLSLTYAGEKYIKIAKEILSLESNLKKELFDISNMKKDENIKENVWQLIEGDSNYLEECLFSGKVDLVLTSLPTNHKKINCELLYEEKIMLACKKGYLGEDYLLPNSTNVISLEKLKDIDFILTKKNHRIRKLTENLFDMFDFKPKVVLETANTATAFRLATSGLGVSFVSEMILNTTVPMDDFDLFNIENSPIIWNISISYLKNAYLNDAQRYFIDCAKSVLNEN